MKTLKRIAPIGVVLCMAICLGATKSPDNAKASVPPGVNKADWHSITDDFGYVLRITKEPRAQSVLRGRTKRSIRENSTDEEKRLHEQMEKQRQDHIARLKAVPKNSVGQAQAVFFARHRETWYMVTTPPPSIKPYLIQQ